MQQRRARHAALLLAFLLLAAACGGNDSADTEAATDDGIACDWPMWGQNPQRTFAYPCDTKISRDTAPRLVEKWFHETRDVVTASPAIAGGSIFVGDWSGRFYSLSLADGSERWHFDAPSHANVYSGQIVSSAAVADVAGERRVYFASGKTLYALRADDGTVRFEHELNPGGGPDDPTEIQSSPVVVEGMVLFGFDGHDSPGTRAGLMALDATTGDENWFFDPDAGREPSGCAGMWSSPTVDVERDLVFIGTANCPTSPQGWSEYSEAIVAVDLRTGEPKWSFQPRGPSNEDFDFAGAPNLFEAGATALVGLGGKDGVYYALNRATGDLAWKVEASIPRVQARNFSTGGFIGPTAVDDGVVVGGTAIDGPCPCLHGIDAETGELAWQTDGVGATFGGSAIANGVAFVGSTTDFTLRAVDLETGEVLWSHAMVGGVAGAVAISGDVAVAVAGIREPGLDPVGTTSGVSAFVIGAAGEATTSTAPPETLPPSTQAPPPTDPNPAAGGGPRCVGQPCSLGFSLKAPPAGTDPSMTVHVEASPFRVEVRADGMGEPGDWITPNTPSADVGAVAFGVFLSDDALHGVLLCVLDDEFDCVNDKLPAGTDGTFNRISILAIANTPTLPSPQDGFARLVTTTSLDEPMTLLSPPT